jgi:peroxiredoxin
MTKLLKRSLLILLILFMGCSHTDRGFEDSPQKVNPLLNGQMAPEVSLRDLNGTEVGLGKVLSAGPTVLVFYRGGWCPYCNLQLKGLRKIMNKTKKLGYQIVAISPDRPEKMNESKGKQKINYTLLSDSKLLAAQKFGLAYKLNPKTLKKFKKYGIDLVGASGETHFSLPVPAVYILDTKGKIHFSYVNPDYKTRIHEKILLSALKNLKLN